MKYLKRLLGLPFFLMLNIIGMVFMLFRLTKYFMLYGGEAIAYEKKNKQKMIADVYDFLEQEKLKNHEINKENTKVQLAITCKCGCCTIVDELVKKLDKYYCPKCDKNIISIRNQNT